MSGLARTTRAARTPATSAASPRVGRHVTLKLAVSADGKAGLAGRKQVAITGEEARERVFQMRAASDAILVGIGTVLVRQSATDLPLAGNVRALAGARRARRAPCSCRWRPRWWRPCARRRPGCSRRASHRRSPKKFCSKKAARSSASRTSNGELDLEQVLKVLAEQGITRLMVEGGPKVAGEFRCRRPDGRSGAAAW